MTKELFREDAYSQVCDAEVCQVTSEGLILDQTIFYPEGGGQPGDTGSIVKLDGLEMKVLNTLKTPHGILHMIEGQFDGTSIGDRVKVNINWERRFMHMKMHTALHLLCSQVEGAVTGGAIGAQKSRLDFDMPGERPEKEDLEQRMNNLINLDHSISISWISDEELKNNPDLVRTMSVKPPMGSGQVRMICIGENVDFQPCGGTHVKSTAEIGVIRIAKIENKGRQNRRVHLTIDN
ncbi:MAG: alanyl-tRNA editing protein [Rhodospirillaceae bacterium]|nr:alanyl-tRNA editing protein [Rhodospirillaceae bacterium]